MKPYSEFRPTQFDACGLGCDERQDWLVGPCATNRDADALTRSNWRSLCKALEAIDPDGNDHEVHCFDHWGPGWFEIVLIKPDTPCATEAEEIEAALTCYPVVCNDDYSEEEMNEANEVWERCYNTKERLAYIREHREQFEFRDLEDMLGCVRGKYFAGWASELLS